MIQTNKEREANGLSHKFKNLVMDNYFYSQNVFKSCLLFMRENEYPWCKGLKSSLVLRELRVIFVESINSAFFFFFFWGGWKRGKDCKILTICKVSTCASLCSPHGSTRYTIG